MQLFFRSITIVGVLVSSTALCIVYIPPVYVPFTQDQRLGDSQSIVNGERHIVVISCSYNNSDFYEWNLDSVRAQNYSNYHIVYVDDSSEDRTGYLVKKYAQEHGFKERMILIRNTIRQKALANLYYAISMCKPTDIIVILDGDDRFAHSEVLARVNQIYEDSSVWLTYGQFKEYPSGDKGFCCPYPKDIIDLNWFRYNTMTPSHLRTFYAGLFHKINVNDLKFQGYFFPITYDLAIMFPMIEMAQKGHFRFVAEVLLDYNAINPLNDHKVGKKLQRKFDLIIRARTCYEAIESPF